MSLRKRISLFFLLAAAAIIFILYTASHFFILNSFTALEAEKEKDDMKRVLLAAEKLKNNLANQLTDSANAKSVQTAISANNSELSVYFHDHLFLKNNLSSVLVLDKNQKAFFQKTMNFENKTSSPASPELLSFISAHPDLVFSRPFSDIHEFNGKAFFIALQPVKDNQGEQIGTILLSRLFNLPAIAHITRVPVRLKDVDTTIVPENAEGSLSGTISQSPIWIKRNGEQSHTIYTALYDNWKQPAAVIGFDAPRDIYLHGRKLVFIWVLFLITTTVFLFATALVLLNTFVFSRLHAFVQNVSAVRHSNELSLRLPVKGNDEIAKLEREFNRLLAFVEQSRTQISKLAYEDSLTRLPNRAYFFHEVSSKLKAHGTIGAKAAVMFLDLDGFKQINDRYGHEAGDLLLKHVAKQLRQNIRDSDIACRLGGDEFVLFIPMLHKEEETVKIAERICEALHKPAFINGQLFQVSASIGIGFYPVHGSDLHTLVSNADAAMFDAKSSGKNRFSFYHDVD